MMMMMMIPYERKDNDRLRRGTDRAVNISAELKGGGGVGRYREGGVV